MADGIILTPGKVFVATRAGDYVSISGSVGLLAGTLVTGQSGLNVVVQSGLGVVGSLSTSVSGQPVALTSGTLVTGQSGLHVVVESGLGVIISGGTSVSGQPVALVSGTQVGLSGLQVTTQSGVQVIVQSGLGVVGTFTASISGQPVALTSGTMVVDQSGLNVIVQSGLGVVGSFTTSVSGQPVALVSGTQVGLSGLAVTTYPTPASVVRTRGILLITDASGGQTLASGGIISLSVRSLDGDIYAGGSVGIEYPYSGYGMLMQQGDTLSLDVGNFNLVSVCASVSGYRVSYIGQQ